MTSIKKVMKSKDVREMFKNIEYGDLRKLAYIMVVLFVISPFVQFMLRALNLRFLAAYVRISMHEYNQRVALFGFIILTIWLIKLKADGTVKSIRETAESHRSVVLMLIFGFWMILSTILNGASNIMLYGSSYRSEGLFGYLGYIAYFLMCAFLLTDVQKKRVLIITALTSSFYSLAAFVDYVFLYSEHSLAEGIVSFSQYNHTGYYLLMAASICGMYVITSKSLRIKAAALSAFMLHTFVLIINDTWGCQLALITGVVFSVIVFSIAKNKFQPITLFLLLALILTYLCAYTFDGESKEKITNNIFQQMYDTNSLFNQDEIDEKTTGVARIILWDYAAGYYAEKPFIGHGADVTGNRLETDTKDNDRCHCEFLNYAVSFGTPAVLYYIAGVFTVFLRGLLKKTQLTDTHTASLCVAFTYLSSSLVGNSMYYTAPFLFITLGIGYINPQK